MSKIIFLFFIVNNLCIAQNTDTTIWKGLSIKINPLQLFASEIRFQIEKPIKSMASIELTASYLYRSGKLISSPELYSGLIASSPLRRGIRLELGYKCYCKRSTINKGYYLNPLIFYKYVAYPDVFGYNSLNALGINVNSIFYQIASFQLQFGKYFIAEGDLEGILFDFYAGIGIRYKYGIAYVSSSRPEVVISSHRELESFFYPSFHLGCTVGYKFQK